jgi:predicted homoserine dehydrogenase-like protein
VRKDVAAGALLTRDALEPPADSALWRLRAEQDARFFA